MGSYSLQYVPNKADPLIKRVAWIMRARIRIGGTVELFNFTSHLLLAKALELVAGLYSTRKWGFIEPQRLAGWQQPEVLRFTEYLDISGSIQICIKLETAIFTFEYWAMPVVLIYMATYWTFLGSVFRIDVKNAFTQVFCLVFYESLKFWWRPWTKIDSVINSVYA